MKLTLNVTQKFIDLGRKNTSDRCPLALSLGQLGYHNIYMANSIICKFDGKHYVGFPTPEMYTFMKNFDAGNPVAPTTFEVEIFED